MTECDVEVFARIRVGNCRDIFEIGFQQSTAVIVNKDKISCLIRRFFIETVVRLCVRGSHLPVFKYNGLREFSPVVRDRSERVCQLGIDGNDVRDIDDDAQ